MSRPSTAPRPCMLIIGDWRADEFSGPINDVKQYSTVRRLDSIEDAIASLKRGLAPTHVIFAQARRGRFSDHDVTRIHRLCPLAQLISLLGTWCEGEMRTGAPLAGVARIYWHQWRPNLLARQQSTGRQGQWSQPRTFTIFDQSLQFSQRRAKANESQRLRSTIAIGAQHYVDYQGLAASLEPFDSFWANSPNALQNSADSSSDPTQPAWLIWDAQAWDAIEKDALRATQQGLAPKATVLLISWPRREDLEEAEELGVSQVLSKPYRLDDLVSILDTSRSAAA